MSGVGECLCLENISIVGYVSARWFIHGKWVFGFLDFYLLLEVRLKFHLESIWRRSHMRRRSVIRRWTNWHILRRSNRKLLGLSHWILLRHSHLELLRWPNRCLLVRHRRNLHVLGLCWKIWCTLSLRLIMHLSRRLCNHFIFQNFWLWLLFFFLYLFLDNRSHRGSSCLLWRIVFFLNNRLVNNFFLLLLSISKLLLQLFNLLIFSTQLCI